MERFKGLRVSIVGDIRHSRVARSNVLAFEALGGPEVTLVAPGTLLPPAVKSCPVAGVSHDLDEVLPTTMCATCCVCKPSAGRGVLPSVRESRDRLRTERGARQPWPTELWSPRDP